MTTPKHLPKVIFVSLLLYGSGVSDALAERTTIWTEANGGKGAAVDLNLNLPSFSGVVEKLAPSVVNISTEGKDAQLPMLGRTPKGFPGQGMPGQRPEPDADPQGVNPFDFLFQNPPQAQQRRFSLGSGFVISEDGYIVTNFHVVDRASKIVVTFKDDKKPYKAKLIGGDKKTDLALLKVESPTPLHAVVVGDSEKLAIGDWVIAIGNPFRLGHTVTVGIVSAKSRKVPGGGPYDDFIQTDASINPGNSGGPLFNSKGEVIGINTAIYSPSVIGSTGFNVGIGFATPINLVKSIVTQIHEHGKVVRGWLGVLIQPVSDDVATAMKLESSSGALVADVMEESPAKKAGIQRGDVILKYDGREVTENDDLPILVADTAIGKVVGVEVLRGGKKKDISVTIQALDEQQTEDVVEQGQENKLGLSVQDITPDLAKSLDIDASVGVLVSGVAPGSAAEDSGLERGDVILEVASRSVNSKKEFSDLTKDMEKGKPLLLLVKRGENTIFLTLKYE